MISATIALALGIALLVWSADRFVEASAHIAKHFGVSTFLIGMVVVGFGTSAPEMVVSALAAFQGNPGIALGNAFGSNITNIALILGLTALLSPIAVDRKVLRQELPTLIALTVFTAVLLSDNDLSRLDAIMLLMFFALLMSWTMFRGMRNGGDNPGQEVIHELNDHHMTLRQATLWLLAGLIVLSVSSRMLVWGAVGLAQGFGVSDLVIGLTVIALGTSLPELASSLAATRRGEHGMVLGNVLGSNIFNTLAVIGIAGVIHPLGVDPLLFSRDVTVTILLTASIFVLGYGFRRAGRITRWGGAALLCAYIGYMTVLARTTFLS